MVIKQGFNFMQLGPGECALLFQSSPSQAYTDYDKLSLFDSLRRTSGWVPKALLVLESFVTIAGKHYGVLGVGPGYAAHFGMPLWLI